MPQFEPAPESQSDLDYTPRFYCQRCGAGVPAVCLSEHAVLGGVVREITCPACHCMERVGIQLAEDFTGWVFFRPEAPVLHEDDPEGGPENAAAPGQKR
ncbi:MAG: hypothetical protein AB9900_02230 [Humidesulfovibrio sp.]